MKVRCIEDTVSMRLTRSHHSSNINEHQRTSTQKKPTKTYGTGNISPTRTNSPHLATISSSSNPLLQPTNQLASTCSKITPNPHTYRGWQDPIPAPHALQNHLRAPPHAIREDRDSQTSKLASAGLAVPVDFGAVIPHQELVHRLLLTGGGGVDGGDAGDVEDAGDVVGTVWPGCEGVGLGGHLSLC